MLIIVTGQNEVLFTNGRHDDDYGCGNDDDDGKSSIFLTFMQCLIISVHIYKLDCFFFSFSLISLIY